MAYQCICAITLNTLDNSLLLSRQAGVSSFLSRLAGGSMDSGGSADSEFPVVGKTAKDMNLSLVFQPNLCHCTHDRFCLHISPNLYRSDIFQHVPLLFPPVPPGRGLWFLRHHLVFELHSIHGYQDCISQIMRGFSGSFGRQQVHVRE